MPKIAKKPSSKSCEWDHETCRRVVTYHELNMSYHKVGAMFSPPMSHATVQSIIRSYKAQGSIENKLRTGRQPKLDNRDKRHIQSAVLKSADTHRAPLKELADGLNLGVSDHTIRRAMKDVGINSHPAVVKPFISALNAKNRVDWCKDKVDWSLKKWKKVLWTDETSVEVQGTGSKRVMVWRKPGERFKQACLAPSFKSGRVSVMMWGCFVGKHLGPIVLFPKGKINSKRYCELLEEHLLPFLSTLPKNTIFVQDNAPIHTSKYTKLWMEENGIDALTWPPQSPDLNPIENIWHELKVALEKRRPRVKCRDELLVAVQEEWEKLREKNSLENLVKSMHTRCEEVIASKGMPINY